MNSSFCINQIRRISQKRLDSLKVIPSQNLIWKANENDPRQHTIDHEGLFYQLPDEKQMLNIFGRASPFDSNTTKHYKTWGLFTLMVRQPALTAIDYLKKVKDSKPNVRILFYGDHGHGKSHTLVHLSHYLNLKQDHVIINVREVDRFTSDPREFSESNSRPGRVNTPLDAALLLQRFRIQNANLLEKHKDSLVCTRDYNWSVREVTKAGEPLVNVADHGVNRVNHASDCAAVLFRELMLAADEGKIKLASILDNVRSLFELTAGEEHKHVDFKEILVDEITVARAIKKLIKGTYKNGIVLASCDNRLEKKQNQTPREILGIEGWNHFDPCLPIHVPKYSRKEFESCMNFFQDIGWIARPEIRTEEGRDEVRFLSALNPNEVQVLCQSL